MRRPILAVAALLVVALAGASFTLSAGQVEALTPTPSNTPSATPTPGGLTLAVDCDTSMVGVQSNCTVYLPGSTYDAAVVLVNNSGGTITLGSFDFELLDSDVTRLAPLPSSGNTLNSNPDFNNAITGSFGCGPVQDDTGMGGPGAAVSLISCYSSGNGPSVGGGSMIELARVHYLVPPSATPGSATLSLKSATAFNNAFTELGSCVPVISVAFASCDGAALAFAPVPPGSTATPTATATIAAPLAPTPAPAAASSNLDPTPASRYYAIDCDLGSAGIQDDCTYQTDAGVIDVGVVYVNNFGPLTSIAAFNFEMHNPDTSRLDPPSGIGGPLDSNPDANQAALSPTLQCSPPPPDNDTGADGPGTSVSLLSCYTGSGDGPAIPANGSVLLARVRYNVPLSATPGTVPLDLGFVAAFDNDIFEIGSCNDVITEFAECVPASITLVLPPPSVEKQPEGNAANADLSVPKANLWICESGPCAGPGEGALRVIEHAFGVQDGLGAYEFTVEYDNFVIQSVNPCDLVFGPGGAGSTRGPVDELDASAVNTDCAPDPGATNNGTCAYSLVLENLVHFGCVTSGQIAGPTGDFDLASLLLIPHPDLNNDLFPGNDNGVLTVLKDTGCELVDTLGHAVSGSINGGLTPFCRDLAVTVRILEGDLDLDCDVDLTDSQLIAARYGAFFGGLLYSKWLDLEPALHDLDIDIKDIQKVFGRQGSTCQAPIPAQPPLDPPTPFGD